MDPLQEVPVVGTLDKVKNFLKNNELARYAVVLVVGMAIGALFYPTKSLKETLSKQYEKQISQLNDQHKQTVNDMTNNYNKLQSEYASYKATSDSKLNELTQQVSSLQSNKKTTHYKLIKPDGTVEEKDTTDDSSAATSETIASVQQEYMQKIASVQQQMQQQSDQKVQQMQSSFDAEKQTYQQTISSLQTTKSETINAKHYGIEGGALTGGSYFVHADADVVGPIFLGVQGQIGTNNALGAGIGLRF